MKLTLNLSDKPYINRRALYLGYTLFAGALFLLLILNGAYLHRLHSHAGEVESHLAELESQGGGGAAVTELNPEEVRRQQEKIAFANDILHRDSFRWTQMFDRLEESAVEGVSVRSLQPDYKDRSLQLRGVAAGVDELRSYLDSLIASPHFSEVLLLEQSRTEVGEATGVKRTALAFSIVLRGAF